MKMLFDGNFFCDDDMLRLARMIEADEAERTVEVAERVALVGEVCAILRKAVEGTDADIRSGVHDPSPSMGYVSVIGETIEFTDTALLAEAAAKASIVEIYPLTDGRVQMDFGFYGLTKRP